MGKVFAVCALYLASSVVFADIVANETEVMFADIIGKETEVEEVTLERQCRCGTETQQCFANLTETVVLCHFQCEKILEHIGDPEKMKKCILEQRVYGNSLKKCILNRNSEKSCYDGKAEPPHIQRVNLSALISSELSKLSNLGKVLGRYPPLMNLSTVIEAFEEFSTCLNSCADEGRPEGSCFSKNGCQLKKPPTGQLAATIFQCAISEDHGQIVDTCNCFADAGVSSLAPICGIVELYLDKADLGSGLDKTSYKP